MLSFLGWGASKCQTPTLTPAQLKEHCAKHNGTFIDVRTPQEYASGHIKGCLHIDVLSKDFDKAVSKLDKNKTYYVYCASGGRSENAVDRMIKLGFTSVYNVGGFSDIKSGFAVESGK
ncbi:MAG: rhodanese-like domain-containing protein [Bacteroidia bacterium]|nr:rhodanese-like domain-containing protein [Bacteroidia bacterium]